jgi:hypothetical protein
MNDFGDVMRQLESEMRVKLQIDKEMFYGLLLGYAIKCAVSIGMPLEMITDLYYQTKARMAGEN